jgi:hypothetical protein
MRIHADPDSGQTLKSHKVKRRYKSFLKSKNQVYLLILKSGLFVIFGQCPCSWFRIRIQDSKINEDLVHRYYSEVNQTFKKIDLM